MGEADLEQVVTIDPTTIQHVEMVWFEPRRDGSLAPRDERLAGFDLARSHIHLPSIDPASSDACATYLNQRDLVIRGHGALSEVVLESIATMYGVCAPHLLCLSAWSDEGTLDAFTNDPAMTAVRQDLGAGVARATGHLNREFHSSDQPFPMRFDAGRVYEMCALWDREGCTAEQRQAFFDAARPSLTRHGAGPGFAIVPERGDYLPSLLCLSEWPSLENFAGFVGDADHVEVGRKRFVAFSRMDATATRLYTGGAERGARSSAHKQVAREEERENA